MGNKESLRYLAVAVAIAIQGTTVQATTLSETALFNRCYSHLTGTPVPLNHPTMQAIRAGTIKALDACAQILDKSSLDPSGPLVNRGDQEARKVLNNFMSLHRSWFPSNTVEQIQGYSHELSLGTTDVYDSTEAALAVTRAMFMNNARYSEVLTYSTGVHAMREQTESVRAYYGWAVTTAGRRFYGNNGSFNTNEVNFRHYSLGFSGAAANSMILTMPRIEVGELVGIRRTTESFIVPNVSLEPLGRDFRGNEVPGLKFQYDFFQSSGGGILGTPSYVLSYFGHDRGVNTDGGFKLPRRWAQTNMQNLLCASLPALRESDVRAMVVSNSPLSFRNSASCVMCHANLDQMASTIRNYVVGNSDFAGLSVQPFNSKPIMTLPQYHADHGAVAGWPSAPVANYHRTLPTGKLFFRSMTGQLVDRPVNNVAEMGQAMAETKDFYYCAAKRYFEYLTGISVSMYDRSNPANSHLNQKLTSQDIADRKFVESLGDELQSTQSARGLIKRIMKSDYYRSANFRSK